MLSMLMLLSLMLTLIFPFLKHPMSMGMILLMQSTLISMTTGFFSYNFWFSYILFIIMIGGMLVLFIYMTSIASNEMFKYSNKIAMIMITLSIMFMVMIHMEDQFFMNINTSNIDSMNFSKSVMFNLSLNKYLNFPSNILLFFMIIYLFITLIAVVKITNISYGPLRQKH
uniref:NADH-ubiquinone oxidoreductase chain 6 n=1 Tax=Ptilodactylidae sp. MJTNT-2012 TaxID=1131605 RepID=H6W8K8_9COLE|nr:NADH dehydrogenase subunit 6 [Ptilodactylidae sp. MJTNT-2012]